MTNITDWQRATAPELTDFEDMAETAWSRLPERSAARPPAGLADLVGAERVTIVAGYRDSVAIYADPNGGVSIQAFEVSQLDVERLLGTNSTFGEKVDLQKVFWREKLDGDLAWLAAHELYEQIARELQKAVRRLAEALDAIGAPAAVPLRGLGEWGALPLNLVDIYRSERSGPPRRRPARRRAGGRACIVVGASDGLPLVDLEVRLVQSRLAGLGHDVVVVPAGSLVSDSGQLAGMSRVHFCGHLGFNHSDPLGASIQGSEAVQGEGMLEAVLARIKDGDVGGAIREANRGLLSPASVFAGEFGDLSGSTWLLNSCSSAAGSHQVDSVTLGWPGALIAAGADQVLGHRWAIDDLAALVVACLVWAPDGYDHDPPSLWALRAALRQMTGGDVLTVLGDVSKKDRDLVERAINESPSAARPLAHPLRWASLESLGPAAVPG